MYTLGNLLIQLKNAQAVGRDKASVPFSKIGLSVIEVLKEKGFIDSFEKKKKKAKGKNEFNFIDVRLRYNEDGSGKINNIKLISKPSRRIYSGADDLRPVRGGYGLAVLTTPKGIMSGEEAGKQRVGGEVLFHIW